MTDTPGTAPEPAPWRRRAALVAVLVGVTVLAVVARLHGIDQLSLSENDLSRLPGALEILRGGDLPLRGHAVGPVAYGALDQWVLAALLALLPDPENLWGVWMALGALGAPALAVAGDRLGGPTVGVLAGAAYAVHPWLVGMARHPGLVYLSLPLAAVSAAFLVAGLRSERGLGALAAAGVAASLAGNSHPTSMALSLAVGAIVVAVAARRAGRRGAGLVLAGVLGPWLPWALGEILDGFPLISWVFGGLGTIEGDSAGGASTVLPTLAEGLRTLLFRWAAAPVAVCVLVAAIVGAGIRRDPVLPTVAALAAVGASTLVAAVLFGFASGYSYDHHVALLAPWALVLLAWAPRGLVQTMAGERRAGAVAALLVEVLVLALLVPRGLSESRADVEFEPTAGISVWGRAADVARTIVAAHQDPVSCADVVILHLPGGAPEPPSPTGLAALLPLYGFPDEGTPWSPRCPDGGRVHAALQAPADWAPRAATSRSPDGWTDPVGRLHHLEFADRAAFQGWLEDRCDPTLEQAQIVVWTFPGPNPWLDSGHGVNRADLPFPVPCLTLVR